MLYGKEWLSYIQKQILGRENYGNRKRKHEHAEYERRIWKLKNNEEYKEKSKKGSI